MNLLKIEVSTDLNFLYEKNWQGEYHSINTDHITAISDMGHEGCSFYISGMLFYTRVPFDDFISMVQMGTTKMGKVLYG